MRILTVLTILAATCAVTVPAWAHVSLAQPEAQAGASYKAVLQVPHGCDGKTTTAIRVRIPEGFVNVKPMPKAGWTLTTVRAPYAQGHDVHGKSITEGVVEVQWSGGELPDDWYDEFTFRGSLDAQTPVGAQVYFPVIQSCGDAEAAWIDVSGAPDVEMEAPSVTVVAPAR